LVYKTNNMATKIILNRKNELMSRTRPIKVFIDNVERGTVANGSSAELPVEPGMHTIQCKISRFGSAELNLLVNEGETKFLRVRSGMKYYFFLYILLLLALVSKFLLRMADIPKPEYLDWLQVVLVFPFILYFLYYVTIGKNKYLLLEEDKENIFR